MNFVIANTARHSTPRVPFLKMKEKVLGKTYELSLVFIPPQKMQALNRQYRRKDSATDILAFPLSKKTGELYICMSMVKKKAPEFGMNSHNYLSFLFIHGMLHLQGHDHGKKMETLEKKFCKTLKIPTPYS
ncbi:MAG: rRNA maturation RNase YbeY [Patescibacteria group bacterium]